MLVQTIREDKEDEESRGKVNYDDNKEKKTANYTANASVV
jgi:hypothetical protein